MDVISGLISRWMERDLVEGEERDMVHPIHLQFADVHHSFSLREDSFTNLN